METMRREGYEFAVSRPRVILKKGEAGELLEPYEEVTIDVPENLMGPVIEKLGQRKGEMLEMKNPGGGLVRLVYRSRRAASSATAPSSSPTPAARGSCTTGSSSTARTSAR
jgi:predicted membrane GTPase involved in stress response